MLKPGGRPHPMDGSRTMLHVLIKVLNVHLAVLYFLTFLTMYSSKDLGRDRSDYFVLGIPQNPRRRKQPMMWKTRRPCAGELPSDANALLIASYYGNITRYR